MKTDGIGPESPSPCSKSRRSLSLKPKNSPESIQSISKSLDPEDSIRKESRSKSLISSTMSLFKRSRERKKSFGTDTSVNVLDITSSGCSSADNIECVGLSIYSEKINSANCPKKPYPASIGPCKVKDPFREKALPSESVSIPLETPTKLLDEYESEQQGQQQAGSIVTKASIEHHRESNANNMSDRITPDRDELESKKNSKEVPSSSFLPQSRNSTVLTCSKDTEKNKENLGEAVKSSSNHSSKHEKEDTTKRTYKAQQRNKGSFEQSESTAQDGQGKASNSNVSDLDHNSSESERDSEIEFIKNKAEKVMGELSDERRGLFYEESFEEDIFFLPTSLPLEKTSAVPILPIRKRHQEVRYAIALIHNLTINREKKKKKKEN